MLKLATQCFCGILRPINGLRLLLRYVTKFILTLYAVFNENEIYVIYVVIGNGEEKFYLEELNC